MESMGDDSTSSAAIVQTLERVLTQLGLVVDGLREEAAAAAQAFWDKREQFVRDDAAMNPKADRTYVATTCRVRPRRTLRVEAEWIEIHAKRGIVRHRPDLSGWGYSEALLRKELPEELVGAAIETERAFASVRRRAHALVGIGHETQVAIAALRKSGGMNTPRDGTKPRRGRR